MFDHESGQTIIAGKSELQLEIILDRLKRELKVEANIGGRNGLSRDDSHKIVVDYTHKNLPGAPRPSTPTNVVLISSGASFTFENELVASGASQYARVVMTMEPLPPGLLGFTFANEVADGVVPEEYVPAVEKGVKTWRRQRRAGRLPGDRAEVTADWLCRSHEFSIRARRANARIAARAAMKEGGQGRAEAASRRFHEGRGRDVCATTGVTSSATSTVGAAASRAKGQIGAQRRAGDQRTWLSLTNLFG